MIYLVTVTRMVVDIAGYVDFFATDSVRVQRPFLVGISNLLPLTRHSPDVTRQVFFPFDGVVTMLDNFGLLRTCHDVVFTKNPPIAFTDDVVVDATPAALYDVIINVLKRPLRRPVRSQLGVFVSHIVAPVLFFTTKRVACSGAVHCRVALLFPGRYETVVGAVVNGTVVDSSALYRTMKNIESAPVAGPKSAVSVDVDKLNVVGWDQPAIVQPPSGVEITSFTRCWMSPVYKRVDT